MGQIKRIVGIPELAEEVLQEVMLKIWNHIDTFDENKSQFFTWANRIARNAAIDKRRLKSFENRKKTDSLDSTVYNVKASGANIAAIDVKKIMTGLDEKYKVVLDHIYLMGYSHQEAADKLDLPLGTVKTRLRMALAQLREQLKNEKKIFLGMLFLIILLISILWI